MNKRNRAVRRYLRKRAIKRKLAIVKSTFYMDDFSQIVEGKYSKGKVHCSCRMCRYEQFHGIEKSKLAAKLCMMNQEMKSYL